MEIQFSCERETKASTDQRLQLLSLLSQKPVHHGFIGRSSKTDTTRWYRTQGSLPSNELAETNLRFESVAAKVAVDFSHAECS
jgi:hypothetical protein